MAAVDVFDRLLEIALLLQQDLAQSLDDSGLTPARTHLLWELHTHGPSTQQGLAVALKVSPRNVTGLVDALAAGGFVSREPHPTDRRAVSVTLTELGTTTMTQMERDRSEVAAALLAGFSETRLEQFQDDLDTVSARLTELIQSANSADRSDR